MQPSRPSLNVTAPSGTLTYDELLVLLPVTSEDVTATFLVTQSWLTAVPADGLCDARPSFGPACAVPIEAATKNSAVDSVAL